MSINKENIDQWMFQNVEGELTPEQAEQLSTFIITNSQFENDFDEWNNAHFKDIQIEEYKNVDSILKKKRFVWQNKYTFILGLLIGAFAWMPFAFKTNNNIKTVEVITIPKIEKIETIEAEKKEIITPKVLKVESKKIVKPTEKIVKVDVEQEIGNEELAEIDINSMDYHVDAIEPIVSKRKLVKHKIHIAPTKSKKALRIEKREQRRLNNKPDIKYIKGNGPGVIPMNDIGF